MIMDRWKYFGITHRDHVVCNPTSSEKLDELVSLLPLESGGRILDVACGKAELMIRIAHQYTATGVGVDISPYEVKEAKQRVKRAGIEDKIEIIQSDGADYDAQPEFFDLVMCIGATWVWGGYQGTINALKKIVKTGGLIAIGEPFRMKEPEAAYLEAEPELAPTLLTHAGNVTLARAEGLALLYAMVSNQDDWDRYEGLQTMAAETYAREYPEDPDVEELLRLRHSFDDTYLTWERDTLNWAIYLFRAP